MKRLIVTADDFGMSANVNTAVEKGWNEGILTSASLMVTGEAAADAVSTAKRCNGLHVGLHLLLLQGKSASKHTDFPSITDSDGYFPNDPVMGGMRLFFLKPLKKQIKLEIKAQIEKFLSFGLQLTHIDGHLNIHLHPTVFDILLEIMPEYGIQSIRVTRESSVFASSFSEKIDNFIFTRLSQRCTPYLDKNGIKYADEVKGIIHSGRLTEEKLSEKLGLIDNGVTEIYLHPAVKDDEILSRWRAGYLNKSELDAITSPSVISMVRNLGITLCNYNGEVKNV